MKCDVMKRWLRGEGKERKGEREIEERKEESSGNSRGID